MVCGSKELLLFLSQDRSLSDWFHFPARSAQIQFAQWNYGADEAGLSSHCGPCEAQVLSLFWSLTSSLLNPSWCLSTPGSAWILLWFSFSCWFVWLTRRLSLSLMKSLSLRHAPFRRQAILSLGLLGCADESPTSCCHILLIRISLTQNEAQWTDFSVNTGANILPDLLLLPLLLLLLLTEMIPGLNIPLFCPFLNSKAGWDGFLPLPAAWIASDSSLIHERNSKGGVSEWTVNTPSRCCKSAQVSSQCTSERRTSAACMVMVSMAGAFTEFWCLGTKAGAPVMATDPLGNMASCLTEMQRNVCTSDARWGANVPRWEEDLALPEWTGGLWPAAISGEPHWLRNSWI